MKSRRALVLMPAILICALGSRTEAARPQPDANGAIGAEAGTELPATAAPTTVCLELHNGKAIFDFRLIINPDVYPFKITGGKVKGTLCDAAHWKVTGGSLSGNPLITARYMGSDSCADGLVVNGTSHPQPPSWGGTYTFDASTTYPHQTLFLGYVSCP